MSAAVVGAYGPMLGPGFKVITVELGISIDTISQATAWLILTLGVCVFFQNPLAKKFGKRPVYLVSSVILFAISIWGAATTQYNSFLASRILGAVGMAPYEILVQATIADLYFVHQRATRLAVWNLFLLGGIAGASFIAGYIIEDLGYRWTFGICAILFGIFGLGILFLVPETSYNRPTIRERVAPAVDANGAEKSEPTADQLQKETDDLAPAEYTTTVTSHDAEKKHTWIQSMRVFTGVYSHASFWKIFTRPFVMILYPGVLFAFLFYGTTLTWIVVFSVVNGVLFVDKPYNFTVSQVGLTGLSPFILTIIAECVAGPLNDWICLRMTKRNHGIYEPEFRLVLMIVVVIFGTVGFFGFGATVHYQTHWAGPVLTYGFANVALAFGGVCVFGYVLDSYPNLAEEAFVAINARNFLTFGLTYFVNSWLKRDGALAVFNVLGSCFLAVCVLAIPLWVYGKRIRAKIAGMESVQRFMYD